MPASAILRFGAGQALGHRRLGVEKGAGNLGGGKSGDGPQGQGDAGLGFKRRVAAGEDQAQAFVGDHFGILLGLVAGQDGQGLGLGGVAGGAAQAVDGLAEGDADQPGLGALGHAGLGPMHKGRSGGVLQRILGQLEIAHAGDQGSKDAPPVGAQGNSQGSGGIGGARIAIDWAQL